MSALLISNNPRYLDNPPVRAELRFVDGPALDALIAARDLAHQGYVLANHPLYGNFRPHQQPYRSLIMLPPRSEAARQLAMPAPRTPLDYLEEALALYQGPAPKCDAAAMPAHMREDCAMIDMELMRATLDSLS